MQNNRYGRRNLLSITFKNFFIAKLATTIVVNSISFYFSQKVREKNANRT